MLHITLVLLGLSFDIAGAVIIVQPLLNRYTKIDHSKEIGMPIQDHVDKYQGREIDYGYKDQNKAKLGVGLLIAGFALQFFGNLISYLDC